MPWRMQILLFTLIAIVSFSIALAYYAIGLPLVLPFAGLEMLALGCVLYITSRKSGVREVVTIGRDRIAVESGRKGPEQRAEFQRDWARVILEKGRSDWHPSRLLIRSHGRQLEIGSFLIEQERRSLAKALQQSLLRPEV